MKERATILCCRHGKILLVDRGRSRWALPGGAIRRKEAPGDAALRELLEETSLVVSNVQYVFQFVGLNKRHHVFLSVLGDDFQARPANEIVRCCWIRPDEIGRFAASVPTREIVAPLVGPPSRPPCPSTRKRVVSPPEGRSPRKRASRAAPVGGRQRFHLRVRLLR
ncbi:NUDIX domain-containing protein [Paraburkholderia sp. SIMBA_009]|uniref:NUDIX hydrolase n=1 Tax=Paraburkholderia tropica TaxID=92647 RepID=UPI000944624B|nr:NUDIX domain-containing protein [Paraburkholderia tropica]RQN36267.1 NUDIX domain-containing protein [Paraburkholderia tropica]